MIMEPCVALKRNICIYLIVYINFYSFTDLSRDSASQGSSFVFFNCFYALPQRLLPKQKRSVETWGELLHIQFRGGCVVKGHPSPPYQLALEWPCAPTPPALWPVFRWDLNMGRWAVRPWRINQKALLVKVFSSVLCLCVYPNALEDYLCCLGLLICRSGWVTLEWWGCIRSFDMVHLLCWRFLKPIWRM